jgi:hypothetical protein
MVPIQIKKNKFTSISPAKTSPPSIWLPRHSQNQIFYISLCCSKKAVNFYLKYGNQNANLFDISAVFQFLMQ